MKKIKIAILTIIILLIAGMGTGHGGDFFLGLDAGYFAPAEGSIKDLYGSGGMTFGVNAAYKFMTSFSIQANYDFYSAEGETTMSAEAIKLKQNTLRLGGFYHVDLGGISPKFGAGVSMNMVRENNPWEDFKENKLGWFAAAGFDISFAGPFMVGLELVYNDAKIPGALGDEPVGGLSALFNLKVKI